MKKIILFAIAIITFGCSPESNTETPSSDFTDIDGNKYTPIVIGKQTWFKENLNVTKYSDGTIIPEVTDPAQWATLKTGAWCYYDYDSSNGEYLGKLYNWYAVAGIYDTASLNSTSLRKKLAPQGCHIPTDSEWTALTNFLGSAPGDKLKEAGVDFWIDSSEDVTNSTNFTARAGGICVENGEFHLLAYHGYWWTSSNKETDVAWNRSLNYNNNIVCKSFDNMKYGFSVRFIKD